MLRCRKIRNGIVAFSPFFHCTMQKAPRSKTAPTKVPITSDEAHDLDCPPHWSARTRQHTAPMINTMPEMSRRETFCLNVLGASRRSSSGLVGRFKMNRRTTKAAAPMGRFLCVTPIQHNRISARITNEGKDWKRTTCIQKHHRQLKLSVSKPPIGGPKQTASPKTLSTIPIVMGLFASETVSPMMARAPWYRPAAPTPWTALPRMKTGEFGLVAARTEPTSCGRNSQRPDLEYGFGQRGELCGRL